MLNFTGAMKVHLAVAPVDLRKRFTGLWALTVNILKEDPSTGALFAFTNRRRNRVKVLYWDGTGLWVMIKRLEQGTFTWPKGVDVENGKLSLRPEALALLLDGVDMRRGSFRPWYQRD
jgi:transposase